MKIRLSWVAASITAVAVLACSGATSSTTNVSPTQACSDLGTNICNKLNSCAPFYVTLAYGSVSNCATRFGIDCPNTITATGSGATASNVEACAQAYSSASCQELESNTQPSACTISGTLTAGTVCGADQQCVGPNGYCKIGTNSVCGACGTKSAAGGDCTSSSDCQSSLTCGTAAGATTGACVSPGAAGAMCDSGHPCQGGLVCYNTTCSAPAEAGQACDSTAQNCDLQNGLYCSPTSKVCATAQTAMSGGACGYDASSGTYTLCANGASCNGQGTTTQGTCGAVAADGAACGTNMATCTGPAICVNNVCTLPNAASCH